MKAWEDCTDMTEEWIAKAIKSNPVTVLGNGNIRTCPVRLSFPNLFELDNNGKFSATLLFYPGSNVDVLVAAAKKANAEKWPNLPEKSLFLPFHDGSEKSQFSGYEEGVMFFGASADKKHKPPVVRPNLSPVVNEDAVYPGVWAIITLRPYTFAYTPEGSKSVMKRGAGFGLSSVMLIADDQKLGGSFSDPNEDFAGVNVDPADHSAALDMLA